MRSSLTGAVLLTGGAGYIGSHTYVALMRAGLRAVILDDLSNSKPAVLGRLEAITGQPVAWHLGTIMDRELVEGVIRQHAIRAVVHFAGFKAVGESVEQPLKYYANNVAGMVTLLQAMEAAGCRTMIFSSSATVYGDPASVPIRESFPRSHTNPYGHTKLVCEEMLAAIGRSDPSWRVAVLRYFNPVGAHCSGSIGEDPGGPPNNLMPYVAQVAVGKRPYVQVFGNDYDTPDGTGVRDYIHVEDLAEGHVAAAQRLLAGKESFIVNLGTGRGYSVLDVIRAFEQASGQPVPYRFAPRRPGDVAACFADPARAHQLLGWRATKSLATMCADAWRWQQRNPEGYPELPGGSVSPPAAAAPVARPVRARRPRMRVA